MKINQISIILFIFCTFNYIHAQTYEGCLGTANPHPIWTQSPQYQKQVQYGVLYKTGPENNTISVIHLTGNYYQMGLAHGQLLKEEIQQMVPQFLVFAEAAIEEYIGKYIDRLPHEIISIIDRLGLRVALDYIALETKPFTPDYFYEELRGVAEGSGVDFDDLLRVHMFPELIRASCSIVGAWGDATLNNRLLQLRALDWGLDSPLANYPAYIVYHPSSGNGNTFAMLSWSGFIGALTGYSQHVGISQKVWLAYNGTFTYKGTPFFLVLKQILQFDTSIVEAVDRIKSAHRTCSVFMGIGSNSTNTAVIVEYSLDTVNVFSDNTPFPGFKPSPPQHPLINDVVYVDKHRQPSSDPCMANYLTNNTGSLDVNAIINLCAYQQTGDLHIGIYDYLENQVYVSVASTNSEFPYPSDALSPSYANQFIQFDMNSLFSLDVNEINNN